MKIKYMLIIYNVYALKCSFCTKRKTMSWIDEINVFNQREAVSQSKRLLSKKKKKTRNAKNILVAVTLVSRSGQTKQTIC